MMEEDFSQPVRSTAKAMCCKGWVNIGFLLYALAENWSWMEDEASIEPLSFWHLGVPTDMQVLELPSFRFPCWSVPVLLGEVGEVLFQCDWRLRGTKKCSWITTNSNYKANQQKTQPAQLLTSLSPHCPQKSLKACKKKSLPRNECFANPVWWGQLHPWEGIGTGWPLKLLLTPAVLWV